MHDVLAPRLRICDWAGHSDISSSPQVDLVKEPCDHVGNRIAKRTILGVRQRKFLKGWLTNKFCCPPPLFGRKAGRRNEMSKRIPMAIFSLRLTSHCRS